MEWTLKRGLTTALLYREDGGVAARIAARRQGWQAVDGEGDSLVQMTNQGPLELRISGGGAEGKGVLELEQPGPIALPPKAVGLTLEWRQRRLTIRQTPRREFQILEAGRPMGLVSRWKHGQKSLSMPEEQSDEWAALLAMATQRMLQEEQIATV